MCFGHLESAFLHSLPMGRLRFPQINSVLFCSVCFGIFEMFWIEPQSLFQKLVERLFIFFIFIGEIQQYFFT